MERKSFKHFSIWVVSGLVVLCSLLCGLAEAQETDSLHNISAIPTLDTTQNSLQTPEAAPQNSRASSPLFNNLLKNFPAAGDSSEKAFKTRKLMIAGLHVGVYAGSLVYLNEAWYKDYPRSKFHVINDFPEWLQVDKVGHAWSAYQLSRASYGGWRYAGIPEKKAVITAGLSGFAFLTIIETLDGFSEEWGWSWGDFGANLFGSGLFVGQQLGWKEQRISLKFSFHRMNYQDSTMNLASDIQFGSSNIERMLKDYNGQTYWLSFNLKSFLKSSKIPAWLNISVGYGATGMFGAKYNGYIDEETGQVIDLNHIERRRQWYLAPDIDFTRIKTNSKWMRTLFYCLNAFKIPTPTLMLSNGKLVVHGFYF